MSKPRCPIKVGSVVQVDQEVFSIKRVGYPLHWQELLYSDLPEGHYIRVFMENHLMDPWFTDRDGLIEALMKTYVREQKFGGRERKVIRDELTPVEPGRYCVTGTKIRKTGTYMPGEDRGWDGYESPYLDGVQTIKLIDIVGLGLFETSRTILSTECRLLEYEGNHEPLEERWA